VCITVMINHVFISFSTVQIYDLSYVHLYSSPAVGCIIFSNFGSPVALTSFHIFAPKFYKHFENLNHIHLAFTHLHLNSTCILRTWFINILDLAL